MSEFKVKNIGKGQRTVRYWGAVANLAAALIIGVLLVVFNAPSWARLIVFMPVGLGLISWLEAREETCAWLAGRGECSLDAGININKTIRGDKIEDASLVERLKSKGRSITVRGYAIAALIAVIFTLLPI